MRKTILWNNDWTFTKPDSEIEKINLPHTWNATDGQGQSDYFRGECKYEKQFAKPDLDEKQQVYIEFRGVNSSAKVFINSHEITNHDGGYSTFRANITEYLEDKNTLIVFADNSVNDRVYPQRADFTFYGGIYRDVFMVIVDDTHFDLDYFGGNGFTITPNLDGVDATIDFETFYTGEADTIEVEIEGIGKTALSIDGGKATGSITINNVHRWDGLKDPFLYTATARIIKNNNVIDEVSDRFGCREYYVDPELGFFLNGRSYPLRGVSRHQDRLGVGNALTKEMHKEDMDLILSVGANSIRLAHYQHDQYFYDLCDELGVVVWAEIPYITVHMDSGRENTISQMKELITQNYNHASIICWALSNEITLQGVTDDLMENHQILNDLVHKMDKKRMSAMANLFLLETDSPLVTLPDIRGYNLYYGWYVGEVADNDEWFDDFHSQYPNVAIGLTEYGADSVITLQSPKPEKGDYTESYQAIYHEHMLKMIEERPYLWGTYVWNMFEFAAAGRDEAGDPGKNHKGLITFDRKGFKDAYYIYKAYWSEEKFVHICGRRYHDRIEDVTEIKVYSNEPEIEVLVDGVSKGVLKGEHVFKINIPISGTHKIVAKSTNDECLIDEIEIKKVNEPNPSYFMDATKVKNWFDEEDDAKDGSDDYLSLNSTMAEIKATPEGAALLENMMAQMQANNSKVAGGMGEGVKIPAAMQKMIERQPLKKLLTQGGMELDSEPVKMLERALSNIKKS